MRLSTLATLSCKVLLIPLERLFKHTEAQIKNIVFTLRISILYTILHKLTCFNNII